VINPVNPVVRNNGQIHSTNSSGNSESVVLLYGINAVSVRDGAVSQEETPFVNCATGNWNPVADMCDNNLLPAATPPAPIINIVLGKSLVRSGGSTDVSIEVIAPYSASCTVFGLENSPILFNHLGTAALPNLPARTEVTKKLTGAQMVTVTCVPEPVIDGVSSATAEARINVVPIIFEI
jgi:hypothetical protein